MSLDEAEDAGVVYGPPETWEEFAEKCQRLLGKGSRVFLCKQVGGKPNAPSFVMVLQPGPFRADLMREVSGAVAKDPVCKEPTE